MNLLISRDVQKALDAIKGTGLEAWPIGHAVADPERRVWLRPEAPVGHSKHFVPDE